MAARQPLRLGPGPLAKEPARPLGPGRARTQPEQQNRPLARKCGPGPTSPRLLGPPELCHMPASPVGVPLLWPAWGQKEAQRLRLGLGKKGGYSKAVWPFTLRLEGTSGTSRATSNRLGSTLRASKRRQNRAAACAEAGIAAGARTRTARRRKLASATTACTACPGRLTHRRRRKQGRPAPRVMCYVTSCHAWCCTAACLVVPTRPRRQKQSRLGPGEAGHTSMEGKGA